MKLAQLALTASGIALVSIQAFGAPKTYQVTGPILEVTDTTVTVEKGKEKWTLERDAATQVTGGELKVGNKATITYKMVAVSADVKGAKADAKAADAATKPVETAAPAEAPAAKKGKKK